MIIAKLKCLLGFCDDLNKIEESQCKAVEELYKAEPLIQGVQKQKLTKNKRHWYNNGQHQKLVYEGEENRLPANWVKGRVKTKKEK